MIGHSMHTLTRSSLTTNRRQLWISLAVVVAAFFTTACRSTSAPPPAAVSPDAWAVVDGREITRTDVEKAFRRMGNDTQALSEEEAMTAKLSLLNEMIVEDLLIAKAGEFKIEVPDSEVESAFGEAKKNITDEAFQQELTRRNLTVADMRESLRRDLLSRKVIDREVVSKIAVTDQQVTDFFNANRAQFNLPEDAYHIAQIVVTPVREGQLTNRTGDDASTPQAATAKVAMLMERLKGGAAFGDLARDYSEDPESAPRGGDLGMVPLSAVKQAPAPLRDAVLNVTPGSARVVTQGGNHAIVFVVAREPAGQRDLSMPEVRQRITETLRARKEQLLRAAYLTALRSDANVVNYQARRVVESQGAVPAPASAPAK
jgi:peptidyl-prolyl cis-trans isomerase SurA